MSATSQALMAVGLIFEFMAVLTAWKALCPEEKVKEEIIEERSKTLLQRVREERIRTFFTISFLAIGVSLQAIAVFIK